MAFSSSKQIVVDISVSDGRAPARTARFGGFAYISSGFLAGTIAKPHMLRPAECVLLTAFTLTGCPIAARTEKPELNPWLTTGGSYVGKRRLRSAAFNAVSRLEARGDGGGVHMNLSLSYAGDLPELIGVAEPFQEVIEEVAVGELSGAFAMSFLDTGGSRIPVEAETDYILPIQFRVPTVWRNITIVDVEASNAFKQIEQIDMFDSSAAAIADLNEKRRVS